MQNKTNIFTDNGLENIFNGAVVNNQAIGFRWEGSNADNCFIYSRSPKDKSGVYSANGFIYGIKRRSKKNNSSLFPKEWTREQVIEAISEAYETRETKSGQNFILGESANGLKIRLWLDENGKVCDAMPLRVSEFAEMEAKPKKKKVCHLCGKPKHTVCVNHHNFPKPKIIEIIWKRLRYHSRKLYFNFARKLRFVE